MERATLLYFLENSHPETGLVRDKAHSFPPFDDDKNAMASIGATGFGLAVVANAADRGLLQRAWARELFDKTMRTCQSQLKREHGWFLHFVHWGTGQDGWWPYNDYSSIDSALLIAGALYAAQVFPESEGARIAHQLYVDLDFDWLMTDGGRFPDRRTLSIGYSSKEGFSHYQWSIYAEQMILVLLGLGHPTRPLPPETWTAWERRVYQANGFEGVALDMPLFVHQYSHLFVDLRQFKDGFANYFENSVTATRFNRHVCRTDSQHKMGDFWGLSAGAAPGQNAGTSTYRVYDPFRHEGTICIACAIGSAQFTPDEVLSDAEAWWRGPYANQIWGRYGFVDSLNLDQSWFAPETFGITAGAAYLSLANLEERTSIWHRFHAIPEIQAALARASQAGPVQTKKEPLRESSSLNPNL